MEMEAISQKIVQSSAEYWSKWNLFHHFLVVQFCSHRLTVAVAVIEYHPLQMGKCSLVRLYLLIVIPSYLLRYTAAASAAAAVVTISDPVAHIDMAPLADVSRIAAVEIAADSVAVVDSVGY